MCDITWTTTPPDREGWWAWEFERFGEKMVMPLDVRRCPDNGELMVWDDKFSDWEDMPTRGRFSTTPITMPKENDND